MVGTGDGGPVSAGQRRRDHVGLLIAFGGTDHIHQLVRKIVGDGPAHAKVAIELAHVAGEAGQGVEQVGQAWPELLVRASPCASITLTQVTAM